MSRNQLPSSRRKRTVPFRAPPCYRVRGEGCKSRMTALYLESQTPPTPLKCLPFVYSIRGQLTVTAHPHTPRQAFHRTFLLLLHATSAILRRMKRSNEVCNFFFSKHLNPVDHFLIHGLDHLQILLWTPPDFPWPVRIWPPKILGENPFKERPLFAQLVCSFI